MDRSLKQYGVYIRLGTLLIATVAVLLLPVSARSQTVNVLYPPSASAANTVTQMAGGLVASGSTLYGTSEYGGGLQTTSGLSTTGTIFSIATGGTINILHSFNNGSSASDGFCPMAGLILDGGYLYGTTDKGGSAGFGTIFKMSTTTKVVTIIHSFGDGTVPNDGNYPQSTLIIGSDSQLYGTTTAGAPPAERFSRLIQPTVRSRLSIPLEMAP
jgi:uncharacterized repeat protein (TIGR03803 family)